MRLYHLLFLFLIAISCNTPDASSTRNDSADKKQDKSIAMPSTKDSSSEDFSGCYMRIVDRDTFVAKLHQLGKNITGKLSFDNFQKDGSTGVVTGFADNGIIKLKYRFQSEGMMSIMDIYFKADNNSLIRGIGEMKTKGDTAYFNDPSSITYPSNEKFIKQPCSAVPGKYQ